MLFVSRVLQVSWLDMYSKVLSIHKCRFVITTESTGLHYAKYFWVKQEGMHDISNTVEAWYKDAIGLLRLYLYNRLYHYIRLWLFCCLFQPNITGYIPTKVLLHCKSSVLPSYTIRTKILLLNTRNFNYLDIFHTKNGRGKHKPLRCTDICVHTV